MTHPNSHSGQFVSIKNAAKGAPNLRGEVIALFHLPPESLSTQKAELLFVVYYESIKREVKTKLIYECRYDEKLKTKVEESI